MNFINEKEILWRENKYEVMAHSENDYRHIQKSIAKVSSKELKQLIKKAKEKPRTKGSVTNTYQHIWGYFKKQAHEDEKDKTFTLLEDYHKQIISDTELWVWLAHLTKKYRQPYLLQSSLIVKYLDENC